MKINPDIFKAYDIRGAYPKEINEETAFKIGQAFVAFIRKAVKSKRIDILVGQDNRLSSSSLFKALSQGILDSGANVVSIGICTTPMFYFASQHYRLDDGGIMITASHLGKKYNGFKLIRKEPFPIDIQSGLKEIKKMIEDESFPPSLKRKGKIIKKNILKDYVKFILKDFKLNKIKPFKIVIDSKNAAPGIVIPKVFKKTKCKVFHLFSKLDGRLLGSSEKNHLKKFQNEILKRKADLGIAFDQDGDRILFFDEKAKPVSPNVIISLVAKSILRRHPKKKILYTVRGSRIIPETVKINRGVPVIWKVGHSNIKRKMKKEDILFGGEISGHYYYKPHYFSEAPFFVLFKILQELSKEKKNFSELVKPFQRYYSIEADFKTESEKTSYQKIKELEKHYRDGEMNQLDGLKVDYPDWWFNVRLSKTEPVLRLVIEAKTKKLMEEKKKELTTLIKD